MKLKDFLEKQGREEELRCHRETPDGKNEVRVSAFCRQNTKLEWIIALLDDLYEIEEDGETVTLKKKSLPTVARENNEGENV
jgi:hypothetical protein